MLRGDKTDLPASFLNFQNYAGFFERHPVAIAFWDRFFITIMSLAVIILIGTMAAYVIVMAVPPITTQVSLYQAMLGLGLVKSKWALIVLNSGADIVSLYIFISFLGSISREIEERADRGGELFPGLPESDPAADDADHRYRGNTHLFDAETGAHL